MRHKTLWTLREPDNTLIEHANAWLLANKRLDRRHDRLGAIVDAPLTAACIFVVAARLVEY